MQLIAISVNDGAQYPDDSFPKMKERARQKGFNVPYPYPYPYDESQQVARAYGAERTPRCSCSTRPRVYAIMEP